MKRTPKSTTSKLPKRNRRAPKKFLAGPARGSAKPTLEDGSPMLKIGTRVEVYYADPYEKWYAGNIKKYTRQLDQWGYQVKFDDGELAKHIPHAEVRVVKVSAVL